MLNRRAFLHTAAAFGLFSSQPMLTLAAAPTDKRLVVIVLRGGMDGLDVVQPVGDVGFAALRPASGASGPSPAVALDNFFQINQALEGLVPLFKARELSFVHAVSTPYRRRSHFEAQDTLEEGSETPRGAATGWVNRLIGLVGNNRIEFAADIGTSDSLMLKGPSSHLNVYPEEDLGFWSNSTQFLRLLYQDDAGFKLAFDRIESGNDPSMKVEDVDRGVSAREVAALAAKLLAGASRIAAFSLYGWDTHSGQKVKLAKSLEELKVTLLTLKEGLGREWQNTAVVAVSEFGRTARFNGTFGTDHGTGGLAVLSGGLLGNGMGGKVLSTRWPGVGSDQLYEDRDLMPTDDVRRYLGWLAANLFNLDPGTVTRELFPGLDLGAKLKLI
jgi:uncharacterized protein (DUF1501 family)